MTRYDAERTVLGAVLLGAAAPVDPARFTSGEKRHRDLATVLREADDPADLRAVQPVAEARNAGLWMPFFGGLAIDYEPEKLADARRALEVAP